MHIPVESIVEELIEHLFEQHNVPPEKLSVMLSMVEPEDLVGFIVKTHLILHSVERFGEYKDSQFHFVTKEDDA